MSDKTPDEQRNSDLRSKVTSYRSMTAKDGRQLLDFAPHVRLANDEIKSKHGTP